jgi:NAD+ synthase (glutamine-hydrolysing)
MTPLSALTSLGDTVLHSWEVLVKILQSEEAQGIICDIGM